MWKEQVEENIKKTELTIENTPNCWSDRIVFVVKTMGANLVTPVKEN